MSEDSVILLEDIGSSQGDTESVVRAAVSPSPSDAPEEKVAGERGEESPEAGPEGPVEDVCGTEAGTQADVEEKEVDVVSGVDKFGVSRYKSEGFTLSEILRRKRLAKKNVSEGVVYIARLPQCEFSNLHHLPLALLLEFLCWPVIEFFWASCAARAET